MSEIAWLVKLMTEHKLSAQVKATILARIGEVEAALSKNINIAVPPMAPRHIGTVQAPSTQRILDEMASEQAVAPVLPPRVIIPQEIVTSKGNGTSTRGPKKW